MLLAASIVVLVIADGLDEPRVRAFERAAAGVLGGSERVELVRVDEDPPDLEAVAMGRDADGTVELSWSDGGRGARLHVYLRRERRWVEREISFGSAPDGSVGDAEERGRLLGFAAASMFADQVEPTATALPIQPRSPAPSTLERAPRSAGPVIYRRALEFAGVASTGLGGTAGGVGATAGFRWRVSSAFWGRLAVAGRMGNIAVAQAATRTLLFDAGLAWSALDSPSGPWVLGMRLDAVVTYFEASHFSEDDVAPDSRSRWLPGFALLAEGGFRFAGGAGIFAAVGPEAVLGATEVYTHGNRVAVVPVLRAVGELGFRTGF